MREVWLRMPIHMLGIYTMVWMTGAVILFVVLATTSYLVGFVEFPSSGATLLFVRYSSDGSQRATQI